MSRAKIIVLTSIVAVSSLAAAEPITVLGLPLGGKMKPPARVCKMSEIGTPVKSSCWVSKPFAYQDTKSGSVEFPERSDVPAWAENVTYHIRVRKDGTLEEFEVTTFNVNDWAKINDSVSTRFGRPTEFSKGVISSASWVRPDIYIELRCHRENCRVKFLSKRAYTEWQQNLEDRKKKDEKRPTSV